MNNKNAEFKQIDVRKVNELRTQSDVVLVDIRDSDAYQAGHIPDAISLNDDNIEEFLRNTDKTKKIICYCYHGFSSQSAAKLFVQQGFEKVYSMKGGYEEWHQAYPV